MKPHTSRRCVGVCVSVYFLLVSCHFYKRHNIKQLKEFLLRKNLLVNIFLETSVSSHPHVYQC